MSEWNHTSDVPVKVSPLCHGRHGPMIRSAGILIVGFSLQ